MSDYVCRYCRTPLHVEDGVMVDETGGDCCWGDDNLVNENEPHVARWEPPQSELDRAVLAHRADPSEANRANVMRLMTEHYEQLLDEQTIDYMRRTTT